MTDWKTGDAAIGTWRNGGKVRVVRYNTGCENGWWVADGTDRYHDDADFADVRPLVVIDPEDREQVERLAHGAACTRQQMEYALREVVDPKPDEPTGLGAVAQDRWGHTFIRLSTTWFNVNEDQHCTWDHVAAVRVLSEGVQA